MEASVHGTGPHDNQPVQSIGPKPEQARAAMIMIHGRNAGPGNILELAGPLEASEWVYLAPAAADRTWYPYSFMADIPRNEPGISSGIFVIDRLVRRLESAGLPRARIFLLGFSQGACLASTYAIRHPGRFGGIFVLSGGLIGPPGTTWEVDGGFDRTPVFFGCSDVDSHIPKERVEESAEVFRKMGADVTVRLYPGMGHLVNQDEIDFCRHVMHGT
jgi:predicted esterase